MTPLREVACPGCGLQMPASENASYDGYFNTSGECWSVFTEVLDAEYSNPFFFGKAHQLTVDTYALQHAGGEHPDKSIVIHLSGLYLVLERGLPPTQVPPRLKRIRRYGPGMALISVSRRSDSSDGLRRRARRFSRRTRRLGAGVGKPRLGRMVALPWRRRGCRGEASRSCSSDTHPARSVRSMLLAREDDRFY